MKFERIGNIAEFINGAAFKPEDWGKEGIKIIRIQNLTDADKPFNYTKRKVSEKYLVQSGDVLVSWSATIDVFTWQGEDALLNQHIFKVIFDDSKVDKNYFILALKETINELSKFAHGSTMKHVVKGDFENHLIPLPSLTSQLHIANILYRVNSLINQRKESIHLLNEFLKSTFLEMFGDPITNEKGFEIRNLTELYINLKEGTKCGPFGSALKKYEYTETGIPVWTMDNILKTGEFNETGCLFVNEDKHKELERYNALNGDIIISRAGTVGKMCIVKTESEKSIISSNLIRLRLGKDLLPIYFYSLMRYCQSRVIKLKHGNENAYTHMSTGVLDEINFPYPPLSLQTQYAQIVEKTEAIKAQYQQSLQELENLYGSLSQRAFRGDLSLKDDGLLMAAETNVEYKKL